VLLASVTPHAFFVGWPRRVILVESRMPNALCWSDGTITINTALLHNLKPSDDELAFVIAHEMAHAIRRHGREQASKNVLVGFGAALTGWLFGRRAADWAWLVGHLACLHMSRTDEEEADLVGMRIAAGAGFDPRAALTFLQRVPSADTRTPLDWLSTHPVRRERLRHIRDNLADATSLSTGERLRAS
jgi:predicted Zn-dependent protease